MDLPVYFGGKCHQVQCRLIEGCTELLLGKRWCEENDVVIGVKNNEIQFGKSGCWEKLRVNDKGHLVLPLDPSLWRCNSAHKGRTSRRRKRERKLLKCMKEKECPRENYGAEESENLLAQAYTADNVRIVAFCMEIEKQVSLLKKTANGENKKEIEKDFRLEGKSASI